MANGWSKDLGTPDPKLTPLLQSIAWQIMLDEPLSGVKKR